MRYDKPIGIIGFGNVGRQLASKLLGQTPEIVVYTRGSRQDSLGAYDDIKTSAIINGSGTVLRRISDLGEMPRDAIVIQTAKEGYNYKDYPPEDIRLVGLKHDPPLIRRVAEGLKNAGFDGHYMNVTNPANAMTRFAQEYLGLPGERVLAFGSQLDNGRFIQQLLEKAYERNPALRGEPVSGLVVGEHGPSMVFPESAVRIGGKRLEDVGLTLDDMAAAAALALKDGPRIATMQGGTWYAPVEGMLKSLDFLIARDYPRTSEGVKFGTQFLGVPVSKADGRIKLHVDEMTSAERAKLEQSLANVQRVYDWIKRDFDSTKQRRDILVLDDEEGLALGKARLLAEELEDDADLDANNRFFFGHARSANSFIVAEGGKYKLAPLKVTQDLYAAEASQSDIIGGPDVLVFDFLIGDQESGFDVARHIKEQYQQTRVIIYTAHAKYGDVVKMANGTMRTRSGKIVKIVDAVIEKKDSKTDEGLINKVKELVRETQFRSA